MARWVGYRDLFWMQYTAANEILSSNTENADLLEIANKFAKAYEEINDWYENR